MKRSAWIITCLIILIALNTLSPLKAWSEDKFTASVEGVWIVLVVTAVADQIISYDYACNWSGDCKRVKNRSAVATQSTDRYERIRTLDAEDYTYDDLIHYSRKYGRNFGLNNTESQETLSSRQADPSQVVIDYDYTRYHGEGDGTDNTRQNPPSAVGTPDIPIESFANYVREVAQEMDFIFIQSDTPETAWIRGLSSWTDVVLVESIDPHTGDIWVIGSKPKEGVYRRKLDTDNWPEKAYRIELRTLSPDFVAQYSRETLKETIQQRLATLRQTPYLPKLPLTESPIAFLSTFFESSHTLSMYPGKLLHTLFTPFTDLDTNHTITTLDEFNATGVDEKQNPVANAWIGVSPDDIYFSPILTKDGIGLGKLNNGHSSDKWFKDLVDVTVKNVNN